METLVETPPVTPDVIWRPLPGSQALAVSCPCHHILFEGTRGPGKTEAQAMFFRKHVGQGYGVFWRGVIFDRKYKNLDEMVTRTKRLFPKFRDGCEFRESAKDYKWVWPTGEELLFRALERDADYWEYHGQEFPFIGWNELCKQPTSALYDIMMSCNRSSFLPAEHSPKDQEGNILKLMPKIPLVVFSTANPYGPGHNWVKARFVDKAAPGQVVRTTTEVFDPQTREKVPITKTQVRIFGSYKENRYLPPEYIVELETMKDVNKRKAWLWGDWNIVAGGALDDVWDESIHILPRFKIPSSWRVDRSFDWGSSKPFSVGWWAEASGEEAEMPDGTIFCPPKGTLIRIFEYYGSLEIGSNVGTKEGPTSIAQVIKKDEKMLLEQNWIAKEVRPGPADNSIRNVDTEESESIETKMKKAGVTWTTSDKKPGSRKNGLELMRERLKAAKDFHAGNSTGPALYFMANCLVAISTLPVLPRDDKDQDDVDTDAEDHAYDETRYRVLDSASDYPLSLKVSHPT